MTSPDGITWTSRTSAADNQWFAVTYGNDLFVAVSGSGTGNRVMTSPDGITWTSRTPAADNFWNSVTYGNGLFVAASSSGTKRVMTSGLTAPAFVLSSSTQSVDANTALTTVTNTSTGGAIASYAISPAAPAGLTFSTITGQLSGAPTSTKSATTYTITATNTKGSTSQTFVLTVTAALVVAVDNSAAVAAAQAEAARKAKEQKELMEILALIPKIGELTLSLGETTKSLYSTKCVKGKNTKYVKKGSKFPKGFVKKK
jgi:hypothetical protein